MLPVAVDAPDPEDPETAIDPTVAHTARIWNYWLGGKDNYEVDRVVGEQIRQLHPMIGDYARADRLFLGRAVRSLVNDAGIRQFLDIGTGLPTVDNTHEVAQREAPDSRVEDPYGIVHRYVDALPAGSYLVLSHTITRPDMPDVDAAVAFWNEHGTPKLTQRTHEQITRFFGGLELLDPGVVSCSRWRPGATPGGEPAEVAMYGGVARKAH